MKNVPDDFVQDIFYYWGKFYGFGKNILSLQSCSKALKEEITLFLSDAEWRKDAEYVSASSASEDMLFIKQTVANLLIRILELNADHKSLAAKLLEARDIHCLKALHQVLSHFGSVLYKVLLLDDVEYGTSQCTAEVIAAEGGTELAIDRLEHWRDQDTSEWIAIANTLSHGDDVWLDAVVLMCEELARAAIA